MKNIVNTYIEKYKERQRKSRRTFSMWLSLALIVTVGVFWQLHSIGIALTGDNLCGLTEHIHTDECYEEVLICGLEESDGHIHDETCYEEERVLICGMDESEGHSHSEDCYDEEGNLVCGMEESEGHSHSEECYATEDILVCGMEESEGHTHGDECYELQLVCGLEEHIHSVECMSEEEEENEFEPEEEIYEEETEAGTEAETEGEEVSESETDSESDEETAEGETEPGSEEEPAEGEGSGGSGGGGGETAGQATAEELSAEGADSDNTVNTAVTDEAYSDWEDSLPALTGVWADDTAAIARSQLGYEESRLDYVLGDDGETHKGYTRYGAWAGNPYGDWDAMFAAFCVSFAGVSEDIFSPKGQGPTAGRLSLLKLKFSEKQENMSLPPEIWFSLTQQEAARPTEWAL